MELIKFIIYDPETGKVLSRTPKSWFLITLFYCVYYSVLAAFWYGMLQLFFLTLPLDQPKYIGTASIIGNSPGVGMRPHQPDKTIDSSMLFLKMNAKDETPSEKMEDTTNIDWAARYRKYLNTYDNMTGIRTCEDSAAGQTGKDACKFDIADLGDCGKFPYGYNLEPGQDVIQPCVLLKINRIFNWVPEEYTPEDLDEDNQDPEDPIPEKVRELIRADSTKVYLHCDGENPYDRETLEGKINYFPADQGISLKYFPYNHAHKNYQNPLVAVQFKDLTPGTLHHVECRLWAKGVKHHKKDRAGLVHMEVILVKDYKKAE
jgi:sodium/potassium-transporting ATPase subunit beta